MKKYDKEWYIKALDALDDLILIKGDRSRILWANQAFLKYYGMTNQELENLIDGEHSDPDDTLQYVKDDHQVFTSGVKLDIPSEPVNNAKGFTEYFHTIKTPIFDEAGNVVRTIGVSRKIVDRRSISDSINEHEERKNNIEVFRSFVEEIPVASCMLDASCRVVKASRKWRELFLSLGDSEGKDFTEIYEQSLQLAGIFDEVTATNTQIDLKTKEYNIGGGRKYIRFTVSPWHMSGDEFSGIIITAYDETSEIQLKEELEQEQKLKINASKLSSLGEMASGVAHEINNPLTAIKGFATILRKRLSEQLKGVELPEDVVKRLDLISSSTDRISSIVSGLQKFSRDSSLSEKKLCNVRDLFSEALVLIQHKTRNDDVTLEMNLDNVNPVFCNSIEIEQVLINLISNSCDAVKEQKERWIKILSYDDDDSVVIDISDSGEGIDSDIIDKIFEPFYSTKDVGSGTGLGLSISKGIIESHGGEFTYIEDAKNTTFSIRLPIKEIK